MSGCSVALPLPDVSWSSIEFAVVESCLVRDEETNDVETARSVSVTAAKRALL